MAKFLKENKTDEKEAKDKGKASRPNTNTNDKHKMQHIARIQTLFIAGEKKQTESFVVFKLVFEFEWCAKVFKACFVSMRAFCILA